MKLICKRTNEEVREFSVLIDNMCYRRDFILVNVLSNSYGVECDREYFDCKLVNITYTTINGKEIQWVNEYSIEDNKWMDVLINENGEFEITDEIIEDSTKWGPFMIVKGV